MRAKTIHIIEDNSSILELIVFILKEKGYKISFSQSGQEALLAISKNRPDLVILDLGLPDISGEEVYNKLKKSPETNQIPVIVVTAQKEEMDIVNGLNMGVDDYITKPFNYNIFLARINAVLKRHEKMEKENGQDNSTIVYGDLVINPQNYAVEVKNQEVKLTLSEFKILNFLAEHPSWVFSRQQLIDAVSGEDHHINERTVDVQISSLRKKLLTCGRYIGTVRGVGYRFEAHP